MPRASKLFLQLFQGKTRSYFHMWRHKGFLGQRPRRGDTWKGKLPLFHGIQMRSLPRYNPPHKVPACSLLRLFLVATCPSFCAAICTPIPPPPFHVPAGDERPQHGKQMTLETNARRDVCLSSVSARGESGKNVAPGFLPRLAKRFCLMVWQSGGLSEGNSLSARRAPEERIRRFSSRFTQTLPFTFDLSSTPSVIELSTSAVF